MLWIIIGIFVIGFIIESGKAASKGNRSQSIGRGSVHEKAKDSFESKLARAQEKDLKRRLGKEAKDTEKKKTDSSDDIEAFTATNSAHIRAQPKGVRRQLSCPVVLPQ